MACNNHTFPYPHVDRTLHLSSSQSFHLASSKTRPLLVLPLLTNQPVGWYWVVVDRYVYVDGMDQVEMVGFESCWLL